MSQVVKIRRMSFRGASAYLGQNGDREMYSGNPDKVAKWLSDGYRTRFNQLRSMRSKYVYNNGSRLFDAEGSPLLTPIGSVVTDITDKQAREQYPHLAGIPSMVLQHPNKMEPVEWFAATKRRKTLIKKGKPGGSMPRFRSRKRSDATFACWYNKGTNAVLHRTGRKSGMLVIRGQNPKDHRGGRSEIKWSLRIHVILSQKIRDYTSVVVNLDKRSVTFINEAPAVDRSNAVGSAGMDRGVAHQAVLSDGTFFDLPKDALKHADNRVKFIQKRMAKSRRVAEREGRDARDGTRYKEMKRRLNKASSRRSRIRMDATHKTSHAIASRYEVVVAEALAVQTMTRKAKGKGSAAKRGLNREILNSNWSALLSQLQYKTGGNVHVVNPAYTSQRCSSCGHIASENRESQSEFRCVDCGFKCNADVNAAKNIEAQHFQGWAIPAWSKGKTVEAQASSAPALKRKLHVPSSS